MIENVWYVWKMKYLLFFCRVPIKFCAPIATMIMGRREKLLVRAAGYQLSKGSACLVQALINSLSGLKMVCRVKLFHGDSKYLLFLRKIMMWWHQLNTMYVNKKQSLRPVHLSTDIIVYSSIIFSLCKEAEICFFAFIWSVELVGTRCWSWLKSYSCLFSDLQMD